MGRPLPKQLRLGTLARSDGLLWTDAPVQIPFGPDRAEVLRTVSVDVNHPEESYRASVPLEHRRRYGQFFTPSATAQLMSWWIAERSPLRVLDAGVGVGILSREVLSSCPHAHVTAVDIDPLVIDACGQSLGRDDRLEFVIGDFLTWSSSATFDAVISNPPYLRHHDMNYQEDIFRQVGRRSGVRLSRLTNAYGLFVLEICRRLRPGGRAAIIVPGEWVNANFGEGIKAYLLHRGLLRVLVYYSHAGKFFDDALTTASILLIENNESGSQPVRTLYVEGEPTPDELRKAITYGHAATEGLRVREFDPLVLLAHPKWNGLLRGGIQQEVPGMVPLSRLAETRRGIATGANQFFHVSAGTIRDRQIGVRHIRECVGRAADVRGYVFTRADVERLVESDRRTNLLMFAEPLGEPDLAYLERGKAEGLPSRYLLNSRTPWFAMEQRPPAPIWAAVFGRRGLRFVWNSAGVLNLTTFHCVYPNLNRPGLVPALVACLNSNVVQSRAARHHRVYGGGLMKFEPKDLLEIEVPDLTRVSQQCLEALARALERIDAAERTGDARDESLSELNALVGWAIQEASEATLPAPGEPAANPDEGLLLWEQHTHRAAPAG